MNSQIQQRAMPKEGWCLQRTRGRLSLLLWSALFLFLAVIFTGAFLYQLPMDRTGWDTMDKVFFYVSAPVGLGFAAACVWMAYVGIRDAFFPEKSTLANSIRAQLPYPDEAPPVKELFGMVDNDIRENGMWFDRVAVGKEWVLGDEVSYIPRIRAVFGRDEIKRHHSKNRTTTTRLIELYILDDRRQSQMSSLRDPNELPMLIDCLKLRAPDALFLPYSQYTDYLTMTDDKWDNLDREYRNRKAQREAKAAQAAKPAVSSAAAAASSWDLPPIPHEEKEASKNSYPPKLVLFSASGAGQSHERFTREDVEVGADGIVDGSYQQVDLTLPGGYLWVQVKTGDKMDGRCTVTATWPDGKVLRYYATKCTHRQAATYLMDYCDGNLRPSDPDWKDITKKMAQR